VVRQLPEAPEISRRQRTQHLGDQPLRHFLQLVTDGLTAGRLTQCTYCLAWALSRGKTAANLQQSLDILCLVMAMTASTTFGHRKTIPELPFAQGGD